MPSTTAMPLPGFDIGSRPTTLNQHPGESRKLNPSEEQELERQLHRQVLQTIRETFGQD